MPYILSYVLAVAAVILTNIYSAVRAATTEPVIVITKTSSSCTRPLHTVYVYTSDSSTYIVQDLGSASLCSSTRSLAALAPDDNSLTPSSPLQSLTPAAGPSQRSETLYCAPTTVTAPGSCKDVTPISTGSVSERTITSYIFGNSSSTLRTITTQIPAITSYVYRSGSRECESSVYERTVTSYVPGPSGGNRSCPSVPTESASCLPPTESGVQLSVRTITSQLPAMTSYVYRSGTGLTVTVTDRTTIEPDLSASAHLGSDWTPALGASSGFSSSSSSYASDGAYRTVTSFVYTVASESCPPASSLLSQVVTSYVYGANTTVTIQGNGTACELSFETTSATSQSAPSRSPIATIENSEIFSSLPSGGFTIITTAPGITQTTTLGSFDRTTTLDGVTETTTEASGILKTTAGITETTTASAADITYNNPPAAEEGVAPTDTSAYIQPTPSPVNANASSLQQQGVSSDPYVTAQVVNPQDNPPIMKMGDNDFLLVTFGTTEAPAPGPGKRALEERQATQPLVYNTTQYFSSVAVGIYNLSAYAANAQNGNAPPSCALTICTSGQCGAPQTLDTTFRPYYYVYYAQTTSSSDIATFSIQCVGPAYVGLDNVSVTPIYLPPSAAPAGPTG